MSSLYSLIFTIALGVFLLHNHVTVASWYHPRDHPVYELFTTDSDFNGSTGKGTPTNSNVTYAKVGSTNWSAGFPNPYSIPNYTSTIPTAWRDALNSAVAAGKIPNISLSTLPPSSIPAYPSPTNPTDPKICSGSYQCRIPSDVWDAPPGIFASSFDDGPMKATTSLVEFLESKKVTTTHFMIGRNILINYTEFLTAFNAGHDIAVHTYTHRFMTTLSNIDIVGELGWTILLIANSTGGHVCKFWRPPYGDTDVRVSAIAKEVFHLTTVVWNKDTSDWAQNSTVPIVNSMQSFLNGSQNPGSIILEHEHSNITVGGFINSFDFIKQYNWKFESLALVLGNNSAYFDVSNSSTSTQTPTPTSTSSLGP